MTSERIVVTGGSGFIGSELISILLAAGHDIINLDFKPPRVAAHVPLHRPCDVRDRDAVMRLITEHQPTVIFHLASDIDVNLKTLSEYKTTIDGTRNVLSAAEALPGLRRLIHTSTQFVVRPGIVPRSETELVPYTIYGEAKAETERLVRASALKDWVIVRPAIIWGPNHPSFRDAIWKYIKNGKYLHPASRKGIFRTYGFVRNTASQMAGFLSADLSTTPKRVFYLGDAVINQDIWADAFATRLTGRKARRIPQGLLMALGIAGEGLKRLGLRAPIDWGRYFRMTSQMPVDLESTIAIVGRPPISFDDAVKETVLWLRTEK